MFHKQYNRCRLKKVENANNLDVDMQTKPTLSFLVLNIQKVRNIGDDVGKILPTQLSAQPWLCTIAQSQKKIIFFILTSH